MSTTNNFVDHSSNNPIPDVKAYKAAGHRHLCRKVTQGTGYHWYEGDSVSALAHQIGLRVGHYHWLQPQQDPITQAHVFADWVGPYLKHGDWLMTDFEATQGVSDISDAYRADQLSRFNGQVTKLLSGYPLFVYTGNWYIAGKPKSIAVLKKYGVVMSDYANNPVPNPYGLNYVAIQFTDKARVSGFGEPVDYNYWVKEPVIEEDDMQPSDLLNTPLKRADGISRTVGQWLTLAEQHAYNAELAAERAETVARNTLKALESLAAKVGAK